MKIQFGYILKELRKSRNLNQQDLANHLCISRPTYLRFENDIIEAPLSKLLELTKFYKVDVVKMVIRSQAKIKKMKTTRKSASVVQPPFQDLNIQLIG